MPSLDSTDDFKSSQETSEELLWLLAFLMVLDPNGSGSQSRLGSTTVSALAFPKKDALIEEVVSFSQPLVQL